MQFANFSLESFIVFDTKYIVSGVIALCKCVHVEWLLQYLKKASLREDTNIAVLFCLSSNLWPSLPPPLLPFFLPSLFSSPLLSSPLPLSSSLPFPSSPPSSTQFQCLRLWCIHQYILHWSCHCSAQEHHILPGGVSHRQTGGDQVQSHSQTRGTSGNETNQTCSCGDTIQYAIELKMFWQQCNWYMWSSYHSFSAWKRREKKRERSRNWPSSQALASFTKCS